MKTVFEGVKAVLDKMTDETKGYFQEMEVKQKKTPDEEKNLPGVIFVGKDEVETGSCPKRVSREDKETGSCLERVSKEDRETMQKHWSRSVVFTDALDTDTDEQKLPEEELLQGELWAVTFRVGCYIVRGARRIYRVYDSGSEVPVDNEEMELVKNFIGNGYKEQRFDSLFGSRDNRTGGVVHLRVNDLGPCPFSWGPWWPDRNLRETLEVSARHISSPGSEYTYICRTADAKDLSWSETIKSIYTVKEHSKIPDEYASLVVCMGYCGSSVSSDTWYRLEPTGKMTILRSGAYGIMDDDEHFR